MGRCSQHWTETPKPQGWVTASPQRGCVPLAKAPSLARPHCAPHLDTQLDMMSPSFFQCRNSANCNCLLNIIFITLVVESKAVSCYKLHKCFFFFLIICFIGLLCSSDSKESACNAGGLGSIPGSGRSSGQGNGNPLQYSCLENPMDRGAWWVTVPGVTESQTQLSE